MRKRIKMTSKMVPIFLFEGLSLSSWFDLEATAGRKNFRAGSSFRTD